jgi:hypothetical protein
MQWNGGVSLSNFYALAMMIPVCVNLLLSGHFVISVNNLLFEQINKIHIMLEYVEEDDTDAVQESSPLRQLILLVDDSNNLLKEYKLSDTRPTVALKDSIQFKQMQFAAQKEALPPRVFSLFQTTSVIRKLQCKVKRLNSQTLILGVCRWNSATATSPLFH